jgi:hypothetical protein
MKGGKREGAGRPKGSLSRRTRAIAEKAAAEGITPLEVMIRAMRHFWQQATRGPVIDANLLKEAAALAEKCAPFMHPRLAAVEQFTEMTVKSFAVRDTPQELTPEEWEQKHVVGGCA